MAKVKKIAILGTEYKLILKTEKEDAALSDCGGYRDAFAKEIVISDYKQDETDPMMTKNIKDVVKLNIRHEIVHAFMYESGLFKNSIHTSASWSENEEMVDWIAIQGLKIYAAWKSADAI